MRLPAGSVSRIWRPPGPAMTSLRKDSPAARSRPISVSRSSTMRWMRLRPAPWRHRAWRGRRSWRARTAAAAAGRGPRRRRRARGGWQGEAEVGGVEVDGGGHVVDEVADAGELVGCGHGGTSGWVG